MAVIDSVLHYSSFHESSPGAPRDVWWQCYNWTSMVAKFFQMVHIYSP